MSMRICFEQDYVLKTLDKSKKSDLAISKALKEKKKFNETRFYAK